MKLNAIEALLGPAPTPRHRRVLKWSAIGLGALIVLFTLSQCLHRAAPTRYATAPLARGDLIVAISATGNLAPTKQINVGSEESGRIETVYVQNNDRVKKGQPLAQLDLSSLRDVLLQSEASLRAALATVQQDRATEEQTSANLARNERLFKASGGEVPSRTDLDTDRADHARAAANLAQAQAQVAVARAVVSTNQTNLSKGTIYAPVTGVVLSRQAEPGQIVAAAFNVTTLFTIAEDLSTMKLEVKVDEADVGNLRAGAPATFTVDAYPGRVFPATVMRVDLGANATPTINSAGTTVPATTNVIAYTAALSVANRDKLLRPGMTATAQIITEHEKGVLLAPNAALRYTPPPPKVSGFVIGPPPGAAPIQSKNATIGRGARQQLWIVGADGNPKPINVTIGDTDGSRTEVSGPDIRPGLDVITGQLAAGAPSP